MLKYWLPEIILAAVLQESMRLGRSKILAFGASFQQVLRISFIITVLKTVSFPIILPQEQVDALMKDAEKGSNARIEIDLADQTVTSSDGDVYSFEVDAFKKHCLLNGLDDIGLTMEKVGSIDNYEAKLSSEWPWV